MVGVAQPSLSEIDCGYLGPSSLTATPGPSLPHQGTRQETFGVSGCGPQAWLPDSAYDWGTCCLNFGNTYWMRGEHTGTDTIPSACFLVVTAPLPLPSKHCPRAWTRCPRWAQHSPVYRASHFIPFLQCPRGLGDDHPLCTEEDAEALQCPGAWPPLDTILPQTWPHLPRSPLYWAWGRPRSAYPEPALPITLAQLPSFPSEPLLCFTTGRITGDTRENTQHGTRHTAGTHAGRLPPRSFPWAPAQKVDNVS